MHQNRHQLRRSAEKVFSSRLTRNSLIAAMTAIASTVNATELIPSSIASPPLNACFALDSEALVSLIGASTLLMCAYVSLTLILTNLFILPWLNALFDRRIDRLIASGKLPQRPLKGQS